MAGFLSSIIDVARQKFSGDAMQSATKFDVIEIPANQLRTNDTYIRFFTSDQPAGAQDLVYVLKNIKSGQFHVVFRFTIGVDVKTFSIYRDMDSALAVNMAELFRRQGGLLLLSETEEKLKSLIDCIHKHPAWDSVHFAAATGILPFFTSLPVGGQTIALVNSPIPLLGATALHIAIENDRVEVVRRLISIGADVRAVDSNGRNAFHYAALVNGNVIQALVAHPNARDAVNMVNNVGKTPLYIAAVEGKPDCVLALVQAGANGIIRCEGKTVLEAALSSTSFKKPECVEIIAKAFPSLVIEPGTDGSTPLHSCEDRKIIRTLVQAAGTNAAYFEVRDASGETPLHRAIRRGDLSAAISFIAQGANIDAKNPSSQTALHLSLSLADQAGQLQILKALLLLGASYSVVDANGFLPRHVASIMRSPLRKDVVAIFEIFDTERCPSSQKGCVDSCRYIETLRLTSTPMKTDEFQEMRQRWCVNHMKEKKKQYTGSGKRLLHLLALDGGGIRGLILLQILLAFEKYIGAGKLLGQIDWLGATSTGAIVATALCQGRSLRDIQRLYFRLKDVVFDGTRRPYEASILEQFLKQELTAVSTMGDIVKPRLIITTARADVNPIKLVLIRSYQLPLTPKENEALGYEDPKTWPLWKAVRCSSAAPTYFRSVDNRYVDGGLIANNPTLDLLTEVTNYQYAAKVVQDGDGKDATEIGCVVSLGCGEMPVTSVMGSVDVSMPAGFANILGTAVAAKNLGEILINQVTATGGRSVDRSRAWCHTMNVPYFRFSPALLKDIALDTTDDSVLIQMLWSTVVYLHENRSELETAMELLCD